jgi:hypothetical protein
MCMSHEKLKVQILESNPVLQRICSPTAEITQSETEFCIAKAFFLAILATPMIPTRSFDVVSLLMMSAFLLLMVYVFLWDTFTQECGTQNCG